MASTIGTSNAAIEALLREHLGAVLVPEGFEPWRRGEFVRFQGRVEQRVLLDRRGVRGARSSYVIYYARHTCRPPELNGYVAGGRLDGRPWDLGSRESAERASPLIAQRLATVVVPWMQAASSIRGFGKILTELRGANPSARAFALAVNAVLLGDLSEADTHLQYAIRTSLPYWNGIKSPARRLLDSVRSGKHGELLDEWECAWPKNFA